MRRRVLKTSIWTIVVMVLVFAVSGVWLGLKHKAEKQRFTSCLNHRNRLHICADIAAGQLGEPHPPPYLPGVDGAMLWAAIGRTGGNLNCHHGAPKRTFGGWQGVNLPPEKWDEVARRWVEKKYPIGVPVYWCGGSDPSKRRAFTTLHPWGLRERPNYSNEVHSEADCARYVAALNEILTAMGERPVPLNVPDNVDWDKAPPWSAAPNSNPAARAVER